MQSLIISFLLGLSITNRPIGVSYEQQEITSYYQSYIVELMMRDIEPTHKPFTVLVRQPDSEFEATHIGVCYKKQEDEEDLITINQITWNKASSTLKEVLMYHELTHCILNRGHSPIYGRLMYYSITKELLNSWEHKRKEILDEAFSEIRSVGEE